MHNKFKKGNRFTAVGLVLAVAAIFGIDSQQARSDNAPSPWPLQLEMRVPFEPTAYASAGRNLFTYELYLTNFSSSPLTLRRLELLDADDSTAAPIAAFESGQLDALLQPIGAQTAADRNNNPRQLAGGATAVLYLWIALDHVAHVPNRLRHRIVTSDSAVEGAVIGTHHTELKVLGPPVTGTNWLADDGPSNDQDNHHRRGILVFQGRALISRRYAIDWQQSQDGKTFSGDASDKRSYYAYGKPVLAVADSTVVKIKDGLPDNVPRHNGEFKPAVDMTPDTVFGNHIVLDLGGQQFATYCHLQPGSLRVKVGDHVRRGQVLAMIGDSGDAHQPHVHFQVQTSANPLAGEGMPYLIDHYRDKSADGVWQTRTHELPLRNMLLDFGGAQGASSDR
ncbi:MAG TPA: M23 family metallopeptidase [Steroidobacteraceae bacterium]